MDNESAQVFLPSRQRCFERLRLARFGETVTCVHCGSNEVVKRGTTGKDAQQYWYKSFETYFNDLTDTIFGQHRFEVQEASGNIDEFELSEVCEADEVYVTAGEKGIEKENESPRERGLKKRGAETSRETNHQS